MGSLLAISAHSHVAHNTLWSFYGFTANAYGSTADAPTTRASDDFVATSHASKGCVYTRVLRISEACSSLGRAFTVSWREGEQVRLISTAFSSR